MIVLQFSRRKLELIICYLMLKANQIYDEVKRHFQELVFKTIIHRNVKLSEAPSHGIPAILYDADSSGARNHLTLAKEIITRNNK